LCLIWVLNWWVDNLSFNSLVFNSFLNSFLWDVFNVFFLIYMRDVFNLVFNWLIFNYFFFLWDIFSSLNSFIFQDIFFIWNIFNSRFTLNWCLLSDCCGNWSLLWLNNLLSLLNILLSWLIDLLSSNSGLIDLLSSNSGLIDWGLGDILNLAWLLDNLLYWLLSSNWIDDTWSFKNSRQNKEKKIKLIKSLKCQEFLKDQVSSIQLLLNNQYNRLSNNQARFNMSPRPQSINPLLEDNRSINPLLEDNRFINQDNNMFNKDNKLFNNNKVQFPQQSLNKHQFKVNLELNMFHMKKMSWNMKLFRELNISQRKKK
jgi:hypothetical protein